MTRRCSIDRVLTFVGPYGEGVGSVGEEGAAVGVGGDLLHPVTQRHRHVHVQA